ncbi:MAG: phosphoribosyltransferase family protein [Cyanobacteriota bacterium]|nr:phosphoribosyltransferase family protein [Cyanobacteriota bacterium]
MTRQLKNRVEAGRLLARKLVDYTDVSNTIVLGLPRGGVPVAFEIARSLNLPLDICLVRKLGVPGNEELAMGAIGIDGSVVIDETVVDSHQIPQEAFEAAIRREWTELVRRHRVYRGEIARDGAIDWRVAVRLKRGSCRIETRELPLDRLAPSYTQRNIILVDDGVATGSTLYAAIATLQPQQPKSIAIALPVAPPSICKQLKTQVDRVECLMTPQPLHCIGLWYEDFSATSDREVCQLLNGQNSTPLSSVVG